ncbi:MAG TPA: hypothetical protein VK141_07805 [Nitrosomonas sp.]|nr:hypothetical protein [Nitrosomonas sp.]
MIELAEYAFYIVLGYCAFLMAKKFKPASLTRLLVVVIFILVAEQIGKHIRLISIFDFIVYLNNCLAALGMGVLVKFILQVSGRNRIAKT